MSDFVNKVKTKDGELYAINDTRLPRPSLEDNRKVLVVQDDLSIACKP